MKMNYIMGRIRVETVIKTVIFLITLDISAVIFTLLGSRYAYIRWKKKQENKKPKGDE